VVLAGDNCILYWNHFKRIPIGRSVDVQDNLNTILIMQKKAGSPYYLVPGHDPMIMDLFPEISDGIVQITPRK